MLAWVLVGQVACLLPLVFSRTPSAIIATGLGWSSRVAMPPLAMYVGYLLAAEHCMLAPRYPYTHVRATLLGCIVK